MTSQPMRDQVEDHLLTPKNSALLIIDYQPLQVSSIASMDRRTLVTNIVAVAKAAKLYALPIVLSTVNVKTGANEPTIHQVAEVLAGIEWSASCSPVATEKWYVPKGVSHASNRY